MGHWLPRAYLEGFSTDGVLWTAGLPDMHGRLRDAGLRWKQLPTSEACLAEGDAPEDGSGTLALLRTADTGLLTELAGPEEAGRLLEALLRSRAVGPYRVETLMAVLLHGFIDADEAAVALLNDPAVTAHPVLGAWAWASRQQLLAIKARPGRELSDERHAAVEFLVPPQAPEGLVASDTPATAAADGDAYAGALELLGGSIDPASVWVLRSELPIVAWDNPFGTISPRGSWCVPLDAHHWLASEKLDAATLAERAACGARVSFSRNLIAAAPPESVALEACVLEGSGTQRSMPRDWVRAMDHGKSKNRVWPKSVLADLPRQG